MGEILTGFISPFHPLYNAVFYFNFLFQVSLSATSDGLLLLMTIQGGVILVAACCNMLVTKLIIPA